LCPRLARAQGDDPVLDVLAPEPYGITAPQPGIEQDRRRQPFARADRPACLKLRDFVFRPRMETIGARVGDADTFGGRMSLASDSTAVLGLSWGVDTPVPMDVPLGLRKAWRTKPAVPSTHEKSFQGGQLELRPIPNPTAGKAKKRGGIIKVMPQERVSQTKKV
jgi:hypothetical protein